MRVPLLKAIKLLRSALLTKRRLVGLHRHKTHLRFSAERRRADAAALRAAAFAAVRCDVPVAGLIFHGHCARASAAAAFHGVVMPALPACPWHAVRQSCHVMPCRTRVGPAALGCARGCSLPATAAVLQYCQSVLSATVLSAAGLAVLSTAGDLAATPVCVGTRGAYEPSPPARRRGHVCVSSQFSPRAARRGPFC